CASQGSRNTGPSSSRGMLGTAAVASLAAAGPSFRPSERSEREPESITTNLSSEHVSQINPTGVLAFDQVKLPAASPFLQLLFPRNCRGRVIENLEIDELVDGILGRKAGQELEFMLVHTSDKVIRDADVERSVFATCQNIYVELARHGKAWAYGFRLSPLTRLGRNDRASRRIEIGLERVDRDLQRGFGIGAPQFAAVERHGVEPLRIVAPVGGDRIRERMAAVHELDHADASAGIARQPGMRRRMDVLGPHPVARLEARRPLRLPEERAARHALLDHLGGELAPERLRRVQRA